eukprot:622786-Prorocentrum_minimum.AAC.7
MSATSASAAMLSPSTVTPYLNVVCRLLSGLRRLSPAVFPLGLAAASLPGLETATVCLRVRPSDPYGPSNPVVGVWRRLNDGDAPSARMRDSMAS